MALYTILTVEEIRDLVNKFQVAGEIASVAPLEGGWANSNYLIITNRKKYILTICDNKSPLEVHTLVSTLLYFEKHNYLTNQLIQNKAGGYVTKYFQKSVILKTYLEGKVLRTLSQSNMTQVGKRIGQLHQLGMLEFLPDTMDYDIREFKRITRDPNIEHPFKKWLAEKESIIQPQLIDLPVSVIHGDIFFNNIVITPHNGPVIIDFEDASRYFRVFDLGMTIVGSCVVNHRVDFELASALLSGYRSVIDQTSREIELLQIFSVYAATATAYWRFWQFRIFQPDPSFKDRYIEMKNLADNIAIIPQGQFLNKVYHSS